MTSASEDVFEKYGIAVCDNSSISEDDFEQCHSKGDIVLFEFENQECLCNKDEKSFEKLCRDFDWDLIQYYFKVGDLPKASFFFNMFGIYFRNMSF